VFTTSPETEPQVVPEGATSPAAIEHHCHRALEVAPD
jgi:hypothetical protein